MPEQELCIYCHAPTGHAGAGDGSIYVGTIGPFCDECYGETGAAAFDDIPDPAKYREKVARLVRLAEDAACSVEQEFGEGSAAYLFDAIADLTTTEPRR